MPEYIERADAVRAVVRLKQAANSPAQNRMLTIILADIRHIQPADVVPVRRGRWVRHDDGVFTCSVCGNAESSESYYCRYCGAKMNGSEGVETN